MLIAAVDLPVIIFVYPVLALNLILLMHTLVKRSDPRFSLRRVLIGMTILAVALGAIMWAMRG